MKLRSIVILLAGVMLAACDQEKLDEIQKQIDELKSNEIASVQQQINGIKGSLTSLETTDTELRGYINTLQQQKTALEQADAALTQSINNLRTELKGDISTAQANVLAQLEAYKTTVANQIAGLNTAIGTLQAKDTDLQQQITTLKNYVEGDLQTIISSGDNGVKTWASASFATLEQYNATAAIVATIQGQITTINSRLTALEASVAGVTQQELQDAISALDTDHQTKLNKVVSDCADAIATATIEITAAYTTAIQNAIASSESSMKTWVNNQLAGYYTIAQTDAKINALKTNLEGQLTSQKTYLEGLISSLQTSLTNKINSNKTLIDGLQGQINTLSGDLSTLAGKVATNASNISANASAIATNAQNISANAGDIDACETLIAQNKQLILANKSAIAANASAIAALQDMATTDEAAIAQNAANVAANARDIASNAALISSNATAILNNAQAISDNAADIAQLRTDLGLAQQQITAAYKQAISTAINTLDGKLTGQIATEVSTINTRIDGEIASVNAAINTLSGRVTTCEKDIKNIKNTIYAMQQDIEDLQNQVASILARIQSVSFVPAYSDGKVPVSYTDPGFITAYPASFDFELRPASTAEEIAALWQTALTMKAVYTITKAAPEVVTLTITGVSAENGYLTVTVDPSALKADFFRGLCRANAALVISDGNNEITSEYIPMVPAATDVINIPDAAFKAYCIDNFDTDSNGVLTVDETAAVTAISVSMLNISSLAGLEYFPNLKDLDASYNNLASLDLSYCPKLESVLVNGNKLQSINLKGLGNLETLDCSNNKLSALNVDDCVKLTSLVCTNNLIGVLNVSKNTALTDLQCTNNNLEELDVRSNTLLETLYCRKNSIAALDVSKMASLLNLDCAVNALTSLNVSGNLLLETLYCADNNLAKLNVTANTKLTVLDCSGNSISVLDITKNTLLETLNCSDNSLATLDVTRNTALETLNCKGNTEMEWLWMKDAAQLAAITLKKENSTQIAFYDGGLNIPDANLKNYLLPIYDEDGDGKISMQEAEEIININCQGRSITDLTGIEHCPNLKVLDFSNNGVSIANLSNFSKLEKVIAYGNALTSLNISGDSVLTELYVIDAYTNALSSHILNIDGFAQSSSLKLRLADTPYTTIVVDGSTTLTSLDVSDNYQVKKIYVRNHTNLVSVDVSGNTAATYLSVHDNEKVKGIDISTLVALSTLYAMGSYSHSKYVIHCSLQ